MKRKDSYAFATGISNTTNAICQPCYERGVKTQLVEYKPDSQNFMVCSYCDNVVSKRLLRHINEESQPMGFRHKEAIFEVARPTRSRRRNRHLTEPDFEVPKFGNQEDKELKQIVADGGIITSITDVESEEDTIQEPEDSL